MANKCKVNHREILLMVIIALQHTDEAELNESFLFCFFGGTSYKHCDNSIV